MRMLRSESHKSMEMGRGYQEDGAMYSNSSESMYHTPSLASIYQVKRNM